MEFRTRHIGAFKNIPAKIIELTVMSNSSTITEDVLDLRTGKVDEELIIALRSLADEFEEHNEKVV